MKAQTGHVFVIQGDLTQVAVDGVALPASDDRRARPHWRQFVPMQPFEWAPGLAHISKPAVIGGVAVRYIESGFTERNADVAELGRRVAAGLNALATDVAKRKTQRVRPLIGIPLFGTGAGGFDTVRGAALDEVLKQSWKAVVRHNFDVVVVCRDRSDYTALQSRAGRRDRIDLGTAHQREAIRLGSLARSRRLVLFIGAGVSMAAGLPSYTELLRRIDPDATIFENEEPADVAERILAGVDTAVVRERIKNALAPARGYSMAHGLLASMRIDDVVTTNFDVLYERAAAFTLGKDALTVLPWEAFGGRHAYLLRLHGDPQPDEKFVLSRAHFERFSVEHPSETAILQALPLLGRELVFVGYSMRDTNVLDALDKTYLEHAHHGVAAPRIATVLDIDLAEDLDEGQRLDVGLNTALGSTMDGARQLEIFLDRMATEAARLERGWLLDERYKALLDPDEKAAAAAIGRLAVPEGASWQSLRDVLTMLGRRTPDVGRQRFRSRWRRHRRRRRDR